MHPQLITIRNQYDTINTTVQIISLEHPCTIWVRFQPLQFFPPFKLWNGTNLSFTQDSFLYRTHQRITNPRQFAFSFSIWSTRGCRRAALFFAFPNKIPWHAIDERSTVNKSCTAKFRRENYQDHSMCSVILQTFFMIKTNG